MSHRLNAELILGPWVRLDFNLLPKGEQVLKNSVATVSADEN